MLCFNTDVKHVYMNGAVALPDELRGAVLKDRLPVGSYSTDALHLSSSVLHQRSRHQYH